MTTGESIKRGACYLAIAGGSVGIAAGLGDLIFDRDDNKGEAIEAIGFGVLGISGVVAGAAGVGRDDSLPFTGEGANVALATAVAVAGGFVAWQGSAYTTINLEDQTNGTTAGSTPATEQVEEASADSQPAPDVAEETAEPQFDETGTPASPSYQDQVIEFGFDPMAGECEIYAPIKSNDDSKANIGSATALQIELKNLGLFTGPITGNAGDGFTGAAVDELQANQGLNVDDIWNVVACERTAFGDGDPNTPAIDVFAGWDYYVTNIAPAQS